MIDPNADRKEERVQRPIFGRRMDSKIEKAKNPRQALLRLTDYLRPYAPTLILVCVFVTIYTLLSLLGPYLMGVAIDRFITTRDTAGLVRIGMWMLAVYVLVGISGLYMIYAGFMKK